MAIPYDRIYSNPEFPRFFFYIYHMTTERELLSIVEILKEFRNILLGQKLDVHTDHLNLTHRNFNVDIVMRWRLILEEYQPQFWYIKG